LCICDNKHYNDDIIGKEYEQAQQQQHGFVRHRYALLLRPLQNNYSNINQGDVVRQDKISNIVDDEPFVVLLLGLGLVG
jgi:hypothetical protein